MKETKKHIILLGILLFFYSGQIFARAVSTSFIQKQTIQKQTALSVLPHNYTFLDTVQHPIKEVIKKGITVDNEEEEIEGMTSKKNAEKSKLIFSFLSQLCTNTFQEINISLPLFNDIISYHPYNSLYLLFEVFRI